MLQHFLLKFCVFESWVFGFSCCLECLDVQWFADGRTIRRLSRSPPSMSMRAWHVLWPSTFDVENRICHNDILLTWYWHVFVCVGIDLILYLDFILVCKMFNLALACHPAINLAFRKDSLGLWVCHSPKVLGFSDCLRRAPVLHRCLQENTEIAMQTIYIEAYTVIHWLRDLYYSLHEASSYPHIPSSESVQFGHQCVFKTKQVHLVLQNWNMFSKAKLAAHGCEVALDHKGNAHLYQYTPHSDGREGARSSGIWLISILWNRIARYCHFQQIWKKRKASGVFCCLAVLQFRFDQITGSNPSKLCHLRHGRTMSSCLEAWKSMTIQQSSAIHTCHMNKDLLLVFLTFQ